MGQSRPELLVTPKFQQPTTSPQLDYFLNRPYEQVRIGSVRKRTEPALLSGAQVLQRISPIVVRPSDISPCAVVGSNCTVGEKGRKEQMKALQTGVKPLSKPISIGRHQQQPFRDGFTAPILTLQQRPQIFQKTIQSARNSPTGTAGQMSFAVQLSDRCASAPVIWWDKRDIR